MLSCAIWILTALFMTWRPKILTGALQKIWRKDLIQEKDKNRPLPIGKNKKSNGPDERCAWWKNHDRICCLKR